MHIHVVQVSISNFYKKLDYVMLDAAHRHLCTGKKITVFSNRNGKCN